ncbi:hypothetical protein [Jeotgalibacillus soli]|uniref:Uncharacterized protein n=1 Tax=Jeotgalibacillus soli TaxID=889306 RepID=A0A0C2RGL8_9BACL|nr:hypothetical protein [Jeotgalibacillus soli]KIL49330.1 hypothetical protein KP78_07980 [Jeotgalibacillus soli]
MKDNKGFDLHMYNTENKFSGTNKEHPDGTDKKRGEYLVCSEELFQKELKAIVEDTLHQDE